MSAIDCVCKFLITSTSANLERVSTYLQNIDTINILPFDIANGKVRSHAEEDNHCKKDEGTCVNGKFVESQGLDGLLSCMDGARRFSVAVDNQPFN